MERIELMDLTKTYEHKNAVDHVSFTLEKGKIYGLLGRNGAGKSTLLRLISGRIFPDQGRVLYDGKEEEKDLKIYHTEPVTLLEPSLKVNKVIDYASKFHADFSLEGIKKDLAVFALDEKKKIHALSTGQISFLNTALALNSGEDILLLDEPTLGFDVATREYFYERLLEEFGKREMTIVLSTHLIQEISPIIERALIIDKGKLIVEEEVETLLNQYYRITGPRTCLEEFRNKEECISVKEMGDFQSLIFRGNILEEEKQLPLGVDSFRLDLQELFVALTKKDGGEKDEQ